MVKPWPKRSHTMNFVEYGLKNLVSVGLDGSLHVLSGYRNVNEENGCENGSFIHDYAFIQWILVLLPSLLSLFRPFSRPPFLRDSYILYRLSFLIWALHLLIIQTPTWAPVPSDALTSSLWVAVTKVILFKSLLFISAARGVVVVHLMWWWQPLLGYFESPFFLRVWSEGYSNWDASLTWTLECPRRNYSSDVFSSPQWAWARILGRDVSSDRMVLGRAQGPANLLFWAGPHRYYCNLLFFFKITFLLFK